MTIKFENRLDWAALQDTFSTHGAKLTLLDYDEVTDHYQVQLHTKENKFYNLDGKRLDIIFEAMKYVWRSAKVYEKLTYIEE